MGIAITGVMIGIFFTVFVWHFYRVGGIFGSCSEDIVKEVYSPDEKAIATLAIVNCGATTEYVQHLYLRFSIDNLDINDNSARILVCPEFSPTNFWWVNNSTLVIDTRVEACKVRNSWNNVQIYIQ